MTILCISGFMDDDIVADNGQEYRRREEACTLKAIHLVPSFSGDGASASRGSRGGDCDDVDYISDDAVCSASAADDRGRTSSR